MVFMEAKSLGVPVLTTETISAREMIQDGWEGFVCENSEDGIRKGLRRLLQNPQLLEACRNHLRRNVYNNEKAVHQFEALTQE